MKKIYEEKFAVYKDYLNPFLLRHVPANALVLDVGCSNGLQGKYLRKEKGCRVYGVDISRQAIQEARKNLDKATIMDIEKDGLPFKEKFDVIIFSDILEHLASPEEVLKKFKTYLKKEGLVVTAIPNVANLKIRLHLLFGRWEYQELGILDKTHLRFFTRDTARQLFKDCGLKIVQEDCSPEFVFVPCQIYPPLFARHIILVAKKG